MSEKGKEKQDDEGEIILHHFCHEHPLSLSVVGRRSGKCDGCWRYISPRETAYTCSRDDCRSDKKLHEECAEMPREISLSSHPRHTLIQTAEMPREIYPKCAVCERLIFRIGYYCSSSCKFQIHMGCAYNINVLKSSNIEHPSHPHHLTLLRRTCSFKCDACGTIQKGSSYVCSDCQYWIHESCAALPPTKDFHHLHHHALSLAYQLPLDYIRFDFRCHICFKFLFTRYWVYHCQTCRYVVHINCANSAIISDINADEAEGEDVISFPAKNAVEEMIGSFVAKVGGVMATPNEIVKGEYKLHNSDHQLRLVSSSLHDQEEEEEEDDDDDGDELLYCGNKSELVCDGCTMPILDKKQMKSSDKYISCSQCKYFLHLACFQLPAELPSHPFHPKPDHNLTLQTPPKLDFIYCHICKVHTNGLFYGCTKCGFEADIKCISLPDTIKHEAHPHHRLRLFNPSANNDIFYGRDCSACGRCAVHDFCYICDICEIFLHSFCALLPAAVTNPTWHKHPLPLTFDASVNHPSSFYCEVCEQEMNPNKWMYHCRDCDVSVHRKCFPTASGKYRNIKFGQQYLVAAVHNHPLAYQPLTKKLHCDVCGERKKYGKPGFQCCSDKCEFFMCLDPCGEDRKGDMGGAQALTRHKKLSHVLFNLP